MMPSPADGGYSQRAVGGSFALPGVKKRRLFEDILDRSSCALDRQGKTAYRLWGPMG